VFQLPRLVRGQLVVRRLRVEPAEPGFHPLFALEARRERWYLRLYVAAGFNTQGRRTLATWCTDARPRVEL